MWGDAGSYIWHQTSNTHEKNLLKHTYLRFNDCLEIHALRRINSDRKRAAPETREYVDGFYIWIERVSRGACRWLLFRAMRSLGNYDACTPIQCEEVVHIFRPGMPAIDYCKCGWYKYRKVFYLCQCLLWKDSAVCLAAYPLYYTVGSGRDAEWGWEGEWESEDRGIPLYTGMMPLLRDPNRNMQPPDMLDEHAITFYLNPPPPNYPPSHLMCFMYSISYCMELL